MYGRLLSFFAALTLGSSVFAAPIPRISLRDSFDAAVQKTEVMPIQTSLVRQAEERLAQGRGAIVPHLGFSWSYLRQDVPSGAPTSGLGAVRPDIVTTKLTATETLFQGFREVAGLDVLNANVRGQRLSREATELSLFGTVAQAFFSVLAAEKDLDNIRTLIEVSQRRLKELGSFTKLGRSRRSDLLSSQSQLASLKAQAAAADGALVQAREQFAYVTGLSADAWLLDNKTPLPEKLSPLETLLPALEHRPDIKALREAEASAEAGVKVAKGNYWPQLDFAGNYYLARTGALEGSNYDLGLVLTLPLYEGGTQVSQTREASEVLTQRRLQLEQARRSAVRDLQTAYKTAASGLEQMKLIKEALDLAEKTYQQQMKDYRYGANTNLDVLQSLNALEDSRRLLDRTYYQTEIALVALKVAQGQMPE